MTALESHAVNMGALMAELNVGILLLDVERPGFHFHAIEPADSRYSFALEHHGAEVVLDVPATPAPEIRNAPMAVMSINGRPHSWHDAVTALQGWIDFAS